jgi:hypothetical protein
VRKVTWDAVKRVAGSKLGDLCQRAKKDFGDVKSKITRGAFEALAGPMLQEAQGIHEFLVEQLKVPAELMQHSAFDEFANSIRAATASKLDYDSSERERNILYSSLFVTRLLALPLSAAARRTIEQSIQEDNRYLYSLFGLQGTELPRSLDCFFLSGAQADADASIIITMYRIKERKVEVDRYRRSGGVRVSWETRRLLVPRSKEAKPAHGGTAAVKIPPSEYTSEQRAAAAKLKELEGKHLAKLMDLRTRRDSEVRSEESKLTAETAEHLQDAAFRAQTSVGELARLHEEQTGALAANSNEIAARKQAIEKRHAPLIAAAKDAETKRAERLSGLKGVMKVELPLTVLCTLLVSLLSQEARTTVLSADGVPLWVGAMFCAIVVGRFVRIAMDKRASPAEAAERARSHEILAANSEAEARAKQIQRHFTDSGKQAQAAVTSYNEQCSRARQDCNKKIEELAKQWSDRIDKAEKEHQRDVGDLMPLLVRKGSVRKVSDQTEFPAYQAARRKGFQPGEKPSDFEMQMTALERSQVMAMLMPRR